MHVTQADPWVFRDERQAISTSFLLREMSRSIGRIFAERRGSQATIDALVRAGEIEASLADLNLPAATTAGALTDAIAKGIFKPSDADLSSTRNRFSLLEQAALPAILTVVAPEGFSYYALQPIAFAIRSLEIADPTRPVAVIGIRSIGTTLSAVVSAALRSNGKIADRITVRPTGHPYDRITDFTTLDACWITNQFSQSASFLIVDEGPGRSGSTFLSVADALVAAGVSRERILLLGSHPTDPQQLCCRDASSRWNSYKFYSCTQDALSRFSNDIPLGGGAWRRVLLGAEFQWPVCWPQMERVKFLSRDQRSFFKFEGMGRRGDAARERIGLLHRAGFGPNGECAGDGFVRYDFLRGKHLLSNDTSAAFLERVARYCTFRDSEFRIGRDSGLFGGAPATSENAQSLSRMMQFNFDQEFGTESSPSFDALESENPLVVDGRMQPYEWILCPNGSLLKTDAISHGDDHFFPGPCDIDWDLASATVEWNLNADACEFLLSRFQRISGKDVRGRFSLFVIAYSLFRLSLCRMAMPTVAGTSEETRLRRVSEYYRSRIAEFLDRKNQTNTPLP